MPLGEHVVEDYRRSVAVAEGASGLVPARRLAARGIMPALRARCASITERATRVTVAGLVLVRQRPGTAKGVIFMTLEDETGVANIIVWPKVFERLRALVLGARFVAVTGKLQNESGVIHIIAEQMEDLTPCSTCYQAVAPVCRRSRAPMKSSGHKICEIKADIAAHAQRLVQTEMKECCRRAVTFIDLQCRHCERREAIQGRRFIAWTV